MKVYIVEVYDYDDSFIWGVYATQEAAQRESVEAKRERPGYNVDIAEHEVEH